MVPGATLPRLAECRECHEPIRFVRMAATGRNMPINPAPMVLHDQEDFVRNGMIAARLVGPALVGHVITDQHPPGDREPYRFTPHWSTCDRKPPAKPTPAPDEALF